MKGTILFNNSNIAEPTVALGKNAGKNKDRLALTAVVTMLSIFFIAAFITVGLFVPRGYSESFSTTGDNSNYELNVKVSLEPDEDFIEWYGKDETQNELRPKSLDIYKADVGLAGKVPAKTETLIPNKWDVAAGGSDFYEADVGLVRKVPAKTETLIPNEGDVAAGGSDFYGADVGLVRKVPAKTGTHFIPNEGDIAAGWSDFYKANVELARKVPAKTVTLIPNKGDVAAGGSDFYKADVGLDRKVPAQIRTLIPKKGDVAAGESDLNKADVALVGVVPTKTRTLIPNEGGVAAGESGSTVLVKKVTFQPGKLKLEKLIVYETVLAKPCLTYLTSEERFEFLPAINVVVSGSTMVTKTETYSYID